jgi:hypothetical protein
VSTLKNDSLPSVLLLEHSTQWGKTIHNSSANKLYRILYLSVWFKALSIEYMYQVCTYCTECTRYVVICTECPHFTLGIDLCTQCSYTLWLCIIWIVSPSPSCWFTPSAAQETEVPWVQLPEPEEFTNTATHPAHHSELCILVAFRRVKEGI